MEKFKSAVCIGLTAVTVLCCASCSSGKNKASEGREGMSNKDAAAIDFDSFEKNENGEIVITQKQKNKEGKEEIVSQAVDADFVDVPITEAANILKRDNFTTEIAKDYYGMDDETAKRAAKDSAEWKSFYCEEYVQNTSEKRIACSSISVEDNGKNGLWISTYLQAEYTAPAGGSFPVVIVGLVDPTVLKSQKEIDEQYQKMKIMLKYTLIDSATEDIDWSKADIKELRIN